MGNHIIAPWDYETVDYLNKIQQNPYFHGYTCGNESRHELLVATTDGWKCPNCEYTQNWAHDWRPIDV